MFEDWKAAVDPKVLGSWYLHELLPKGLDFFILTSSVNGILGQATQVNYAAANTYLDALARYRVACGEKAVSMDLGVLPTGGLVTQSSNLLARLSSTGFYAPITEAELLALFDHFCNPALEYTDVSQAQVVVGITSPGEISAQGRELHQATRQPFWSQTHNTAGRPSKEAQVRVGIISQLQEAESLDKAAALVAKALVERFARMVAVPEDKIKVDESMVANGLDSLSAVEARNWVSKTFGVDLPVFDILGDASMAATGKSIAKQWQQKRHG